MLFTTATTFLALLLLHCLTTSAAPTTTTTTTSSSALRARDATAQLLSIAPTSGSCEDAAAAAANECATASQAVGPIIASFAQYGIATAAEQAALLSWMAFESADFKYNRNHFPAPGQPGQGTRTMMFPANVAKYVAAIPALAGQTATTTTDPAALLALVSGDQYSFASAAWFSSTQCSAGVRAELQTGSLAGWQGWITGCVGTTATTDRQAYWARATAALGVVVAGGV